MRLPISVPLPTRSFADPATFLRLLYGDIARLSRAAGALISPPRRTKALDHVDGMRRENPTAILSHRVAMSALHVRMLTAKVAHIEGTLPQEDSAPGAPDQMRAARSALSCLIDCVSAEKRRLKILIDDIQTLAYPVLPRQDLPDRRALLSDASAVSARTSDLLTRIKRTQVDLSGRILELA